MCLQVKTRRLLILELIVATGYSPVCKYILGSGVSLSCSLCNQKEKKFQKIIKILKNFKKNGILYRFYPRTIQFRDLVQ